MMRDQGDGSRECCNVRRGSVKRRMTNVIGGDSVHGHVNPGQQHAWASSIYYGLGSADARGQAESADSQADRAQSSTGAFACGKYKRACVWRRFGKLLA